MDAFQSIFKIGGPRSQPVRKGTQQGNEFGFYTNEKKRAQRSKDDWTCENELYRFPIDESPKDPWERCHDVVDKNDEDLCRDLKDEISWLLIVASLFLAIVTAFTIESFQWLRADDEQATVALLGDIVKLLNNSNAQGTVAEHDPKEFEPQNHEIVVNQLWFLSMTLSLSAVVIGTLCLQWLSAFRRKDIKHKPHNDALALRQLRYEGLMGWGVPHVPAFLLLTVQGALILFAIGLLYLLWSVNRRVALPVAIVSGVSVILLTLTAVMPLLQSLIGWIIPPSLAIPQCPYKSPISWVIHRGCALVAVVCSLPFSWLPRFKVAMARWRREQLGLLTDYTWQGYDDLWRRQRERWGPQSSKTGSKKYSYYLVRGLASAMEELVFQPSAVHIIHTCLQDFHGTTAEVETFEDLFGKDITPAEEALLKDSIPSSTTKNETDGNPHLSPSHLRNLRRDFLNAHALQHFVAHNRKLHRALLPHRVELYIRIKNSSRNLEPLPGIDQNTKTPTLGYSEKESRYIGSSIECPIENIRDAETLSLELRLQFLNFAKWFLDTDRCRETDANGIKFVLDASQSLQVPSGVQIDDEHSLEDRFKHVLKMLDERLTTESSRRATQSSISTLANDGGGGESGSTILDRHLDPGHASPISIDNPYEQMSPSLVGLCEIVRDKLHGYRKHTTPTNPPRPSPRRRLTNFLSEKSRSEESKV